MSLLLGLSLGITVAIPMVVVYACVELRSWK